MNTSFPSEAALRLRIECSERRRRRHEYRRHCARTGVLLPEPGPFEIVEVPTPIGEMTPPNQPVSVAYARSVAPALVAILEQLNADAPAVSDGELSAAIVQTDGRAAFDKRTEAIFTPREFEICVAGAERNYLSPATTDRSCPNMAKVLHAANGTTPTPPPKIEAPAETPEERARRHRRERTRYYFRDALDGRRPIDDRAASLEAGILVLAGLRDE